MLGLQALEKKPTIRPTAEELLNHPWIKHHQVSKTLSRRPDDMLNAQLHLLLSLHLAVTACSHCKCNAQVKKARSTPEGALTQMPAVPNLPGRHEEKASAEIKRSMSSAHMHKVTCKPAMFTCHRIMCLLCIQ